MAGDLWLRLDAYVMAKPFTGQLLDRFGPAGVVVWIAFLTACKRNHVQGQITFVSEVEARHQLFIHDMPLVDGQGREWALSDFFAFTGRMKQTRKKPYGRGDQNVYRTPTSRLQTSTERLHNIYATHWEHWQTSTERLQKTYVSAGQRHENGVVENEREREREKEIETAVGTAAASQGAAAPTAETETPAPSPNGSSTDRAALSAVKASLRAQGGRR